MKIPSQVWLYKLFNSKYFDTWMAVSYLHRYPCIGIHKYICDKLKQRDDLEIVLPQLIHIMFYHTNHVISFPIYNLLLEKSDSYKFAVSLFFHLKSFIKLLSTEKLFFCKNLIAQILELHKVKENFVEQSIKEEDLEMLITDEFDQKIPLVEKKSNRRKKGYLGLEGLLVYFVKSITWNVSENLTEKLDNYENIFRIKKENSFKEFKFSDMENSFKFKKNLIFLNELVKITFRLKDLPKNIQQKGLEIELTKLQMELPLEIIVPFLPDKFILNISLEDSYVLDSAKNSPYVMVIELAEEIKDIQREIDPKTHTAIFLLEQINNLKNLPENKNLKENIIEKLNSLTENKPIKNEDWELRKKKIKENSEFKDLKGYEIFYFIVKSGNDFKQELIAYQLLTEIKRIFELEGKEIWIKNYEIYLIENDSGLVETVTNMTSIHNLKKKNLGKKNFSLLDFYAKNFKNNLLQAKKNFLNSLVGYSLITYFLQLKDRHNGNISIDEEGHIIHVDFGFILGDHPGFYNVEKAPFKFSQEYFELLDNSLEEFKKLFVDGFLTLRKYSDRLCRIVEILIQNSHLKCVNRNSVLDFKNRFKLDICNKEIEKYIVSLVDLACTSRSTGIYDHFQYFSNGYL